RSPSRESASSPGTRSSTSSTTAPGGSRTGPSHRPAIAASSTAATPLTSHRQRRRAGEGWVTSLRPAHRIGDLPQQVDHARSPPGVDVRAELDNPPGPHRGQLGPALPGGDRLDALAVLRVGEEDEVRSASTMNSADSCTLTCDGSSATAMFSSPIISSSVPTMLADVYAYSVFSIST